MNLLHPTEFSQQPVILIMSPPVSYTDNSLQVSAGSEKSTLVRMGVHHDFDPNAVVPIPFQYTVNEKCKETWAEGMHIFHNPNALIKIDPDLFQSVAHHFLIDGKIMSIFPDFFPYASITLNQIIKEKKSDLS